MPVMPPYHRPSCLGARKERTVARDLRRGTAVERGYDRVWAQASTAYRRAHPLCVCCKANGVAAASQVTDHIVPHKGDQALLRDSANWQALCHRCHNGIKKRFELLVEAGKAGAETLRLDRPLPEFFDCSGQSGGS